MTEHIPSSTPCDDCGDPSTWLIRENDGTEMVLCDDCHASRYPQVGEAT